MATQALAGTGGRAYLGATPNVLILGIKQWDLTVQADNYDASVLGDVWYENVPGLKKWNGKLTGWYELVTDTTGQGALLSAILNGTQPYLELALADASYFYGQASITDGTMSNPVNNIVTLDWTFVGSGPLSWTS